MRETKRYITRLLACLYPPAVSGVSMQLKVNFVVFLKRERERERVRM